MPRAKALGNYHLGAGMFCYVSHIWHSATATLHRLEIRATYIYGIGNRSAPPTAMHWAALKHYPEYLALAKINRKVTF